MKKWFVILAVLLLLSTIAIPVFATGTEVVFEVSNQKILAGDEVTVTISITSDVPYTSIIVDDFFDNQLFEQVSFELANAPFAGLTDYAENSFLAMFSPEENGIYSGPLLTVVLKAKKDIYSVKTTINAKDIAVVNTDDNVPVTSKPVEVTIDCNHNYTWVDQKNDKHIGTCTICNKSTKEAKHEWSSEVTDAKAATCTEAGSETWHCTLCDATEEVTIKATGHAWDNACDPDCNNKCGETREITHKLADKWSSDDKNHWYVCTVCNKKQDEAAHKPGPAATEQDPQVCTDCGYVIQDVLEHVHKFDKEWKQDADSHWHVCTGCGEKKDESEHTPGPAATEKDPQVCTDCGYVIRAVLEHVHKFDDTKWQQDADSHWHVCTGCGERKDEAAHVPGPAATEKDPQTCTECGYVIQGVLKHVHDFDTNWQQDAESHWHICKKTGCYTHGSAEKHQYDDECDVSCNVCGHVRVAPHQYSAEWQGNDYGHWMVCLLCNEQSSIMPHIPGEPATEETPQVCTECQYWLKYPLNHEHSYEMQWETDDHNHWRYCRECNEMSDVLPHDWDDGTIVLEATETQDGELRYSCKDCGFMRTMIIPATGPQTDPTDQEGSAEATDPTDTRPAITPPEETDEFPWWILVVVAVTLLVTGVALFVLEFIRGRKHNMHGKYSQ